MPSLFSAADDSKTPVFVLTGFLGSGKTSLLNRLLRAPALADTAVIVNELGEVALDHLLVERLEGEVALLQSGCICCAVRSDFESTLRELLARRDEGSLPPFARVVVETTGLADPAPLMQAVDTNPLLAHFCRLGGVLTVVDVLHAERQLAAQWEARKQVALADRLVLSKTDIAGTPLSPTLIDALRSLNPQAQVQTLASIDELDGLLAPIEPAARVTATDGTWAARPIGPLHGDVQSFVLRAEAPLDWQRLQAWLERLHALHGEQLLRLKGVVRVVDEAEPLVLHGVHHLMHPPQRQPGLRWPPMQSALVLIARGPGAQALGDGFADCIAAPVPASAA
jgi:G3E family GTPase